MKKIFFCLSCMIMVMGFCSCDDLEKERAATKKLLEGDWVTVPGVTADMISYINGETWDEPEDPSEYFKGTSIALRFGADGSLRTGMTNYSYVINQLLKEGEYLDIYSASLDDSGNKPSQSWDISENNDFITVTIHIPEVEYKNGEVDPEQIITHKYTIDVLNENELTFTYEIQDEVTVSGTLSFVRSTTPVPFLTIDEINDRIENY